MLKTSKTMLLIVNPRGFLSLRRFAGGNAMHHSIQLDESCRLDISFSPGKPFESTKNAKNYNDDVGSSESSGVSDSQRVWQGL